MYKLTDSIHRGPESGHRYPWIRRHCPDHLQNVRGGISLLRGSGGNIAVLTGSDGNLLVDAGITISF